MALTRTDRPHTLGSSARSKPRGLWWDAWRRLRRNTAALIGAFFILLMVIMATTLFYAAIIVLANLAVDIAYGLADPRVKTSR